MSKKRKGTNRPNNPIREQQISHQLHTEKQQADDCRTAKDKGASTKTTRNQEESWTIQRQLQKMDAKSQF